MKIACIDKSASDRLSLQRSIDHALDTCRGTVGHLFVADTFPLSIPELRRALDGDMFVVGCHFSILEAIQLAHEIRESLPNSAILIFTETATLGLHELRRLDSLNVILHDQTDSPARIVHSLLSASQEPSLRERTGKVVVVSGAKGGVGTTSIAAGLAHAAAARGNSAILFDLSPFQTLAHALLSPQTASHDYTAALFENLQPTLNFIDRNTVAAPSDLTLFLSPSPSDATRERWLRDPQTFELSLEIIGLLQESYDLVIVDTANAEGIFPYSLSARADTQVVVTTEDPAALHQLSIQLAQLGASDLPVDTIIVLNSLAASGLSHAEAVKFISALPFIQSSGAPIAICSHDSAGSSWAGSGNSIYTQSSGSLRRALDSLLALIVEDTEAFVESRAATERRNQLLLRLHRGIRNGFASLRSLSLRRQRRELMPPQPFLLPDHQVEPISWPTSDVIPPSLPNDRYFVGAPQRLVTFPLQERTHGQSPRHIQSISSSTSTEIS